MATGTRERDKPEDEAEAVDTTKAEKPSSSTHRQPQPTRAATLSDLKKKKRARRDHLDVPLEDGVVRVSIKAIGTTAYDELVAANPPSPKERAKNPNQVFSNDTFPCALISACVTEPRMTYEDVQELMTSDDWAGGEFQDLFMACVRICQAGFDVPFNGAG